jgi:phenylalanyl-tRNA synthetase beta chain
MKISYNWLKAYLSIDLAPDKLSELLTDCGLEVESLEKWQSVKGGLEGVVIGEVKTCEKHPDADRLSVTTVDVGGENLLPIVCGASNVATGQKVVVATVGTKIYSGDDFFEIKKAKLRGQLSEGMICAEDELGLGTSHDGIMVLDSNAKTGTKASDYFNIEEDYVFEIGLTPNRTDAMSHIGVARDIKAVLENLDFIEKSNLVRKLILPEVKGFKPDNTNLDIEVILEDALACPRYTGVTISGIEVKESPGWLQNRLKAIGLKPINNIVDITNFVLHESGQPLHAFDADKINGNRVIVKKLPKDTPFVTLDGIERKLTGNDLMICDTEGGICIGGVFGGIHSGVSSETKNIFLESAYFDPVHIRKSSKYHDLQTDASFRFERGIDPDNTLFALKRAALLIKELAGGKISSEIKDIYPNPLKKVNLDISWKNINRLIGQDIGKDVIKNILNSLDFEMIRENETGLNLDVPFYRVDVTRESDVIEEILRIYGYNNIRIPNQVRSAISLSKKPDPENVKNRMADYLTSLGFKEIMNNSLTKFAYYENNTDFTESCCVKMLNPLSQDLNVMRQSLIYGGLETVLYNLNRKNPDLKLFEVGKVYSKSKNSNTGRPVVSKYDEQMKLSLFITGRKQPESWQAAYDEVDLFHLKSVCFNLLKRAGIDERLLNFETSNHSYLSNGILYKFDGETILQLGQFSNALLKSLDIKQDVFYGEFNWDLLLKLTAKVKIRFQELSRFPEVRRDLALLINADVTFAEIEKIAFQTEKQILKGVNLFDVYEGKNIESGKKSYAVSFTLCDQEKTLTDKTIEKTMKKLMMAYETNLNAKIR